MIILGIETSCDETAAAVVSGDGVAGAPVMILADVVRSQLTEHAEFGGVVPELAGRAHIRHIQPIVAAALDQAAITPDRLDAVAVTMGPGLIGALLVGVTFANGLALALNKPLLGIHHLEGHLLSPFLDPDARSRVDFPFVALLVSGGHTFLVLAEAFRQYRILGGTRDDAVGEAFDKGAKMLGLGYPGGPALAAMAVGGNPAAVAFPRVMLERDSFDFSFSGLKTSLRTHLIKSGEGRSDPDFCRDVAASYQEAIVATLTGKALAACTRLGVYRLIVAGGVGANQRLRTFLTEQAVARGVAVYFPPMHWCTDNGAMIAYAALRRLAVGQTGGAPLDAFCRLPLPTE